MALSWVMFFRLMKEKTGNPDFIQIKTIFSTKDT